MSDQFGDRPGYTPMPSEAPRGPVAQGPAPTPVINAVRLMFARAALGVLSLIVLLATKDSLKKEILKKNRNADAAKLDSLLNTAVAVAIVFGIIFIVLYVLLALQVRKGKNWARIVTWVVAGLGVLSALGSLAQPEPALSRVIGLLSGVIDIAIIILLAQGASSQYFRRIPS
jgi:O-antigen/teichoic acid export membrane protein